MIRKPMTVALAAVLLFCSVAPVPTGAAMFDRARAEYAYANAAAGTAAQMALYALTAACIAQGIYVAGTTISEFNVNSQEIYDAFTDYYTTQNNISESELEAILAGSYTNGNIDLSALTAAGITGAIPGFAQVLLNNGTAVTGASSSSGNIAAFDVSGNLFRTFSGVPFADNATFVNDVASIRDSGRSVLAFYSVTEYSDSTSVVYFFTNTDSMKVTSVDLVEDGARITVRPDSTTNMARYTLQVGVSGNVITHRTNYVSEFTVPNYVGYDGITFYLNPELTWDASANTVGAGTIAGTNAAVIAEGVTAGTFAGTSQGVVQALNPTVEQLALGYDASILQGINDANVNLGTISTGISALDATMNGLLGVCQGISTTLSESVVGQFCTKMLQWIGETPFGQVVGTVVSGVNALPGAIGDVLGNLNIPGTLGGILDGVGAIPGAIGDVLGALDIPGILDGALTGIRTGVMSIPGILSDILSGVLAIPAEMVSALGLEGVLDAVVEPTIEPSGEGLNINDELKLRIDALLDAKAPFCYLRRMQDFVQSLSGSFGGSPDFYLDLEIPYAGMQRFDAGEILNARWGSNSVAEYLRILVTSTICVGLLAMSVRFAMGSIKAKE